MKKNIRIEKIKCQEVTKNFLDLLFISLGAQNISLLQEHCHLTGLELL